MYGIAAISVLAGAIAMLVFRYVSNQRAMRRTKNRLQARILEIRLFPDQLIVVFRAYARLLRLSFIYLAYALKPVLILLVPMVIVLGQLNLRFSHVPLRPGDSFILKAKLAQASTLDSDSLRLPHGLTLTAPPMHIPALREVDWRIRADEEGDFRPAVVVAGQTYAKRVEVTNNLTRLYAKRGRKSAWNWLSNPGEPALPDGALLREIELTYPPRTIHVGPFATSWLVVFLVVAVVSGLVVKLLLRVEL